MVVSAHGSDGAPIFLSRFLRWPALLQEAPTSLALDTLITEPDDLAIVIKTLRDVPVHTVEVLSMRYCNLKSEEAVELLCELCGEVWENPKPSTDRSPEPNLKMIEIMYLR